MSRTRIICPKCQIPLAWCKCGKHATIGELAAMLGSTTNFHKTMKTEYMTEKQLIEERDKLESIIKAGDATVDDANRLVEIRRNINRIQTVKQGWGW